MMRRGLQPPIVGRIGNNIIFHRDGSWMDFGFQQGSAADMTNGSKRSLLALVYISHGRFQVHISVDLPAVFAAPGLSLN
jgi:hypothetical protein